MIGDRLNRKHLMVYLDLAKGLALTIAFLFATMNRLNFSALLIFYGIFGIISALFDAPTSAMLADLVEPEKLRQAASLNSAAASIAQMIGPAIGGVLYGLAGIKNVLLFTAIFYFLSALSEMFIKYEYRKRGGKIRVFKEISESVKFLLRHRGLKFLFAFAAALNFFSAPFFAVIFPYLFRQELCFPPQAFGVLQTMLMVGVLFGSILTGTVFSKTSSRKLITLGLISQTFLGCIVTITLWWLSSAGLALIATISYSSFVVMGILNMMVNIPINANLQLLIPSEMRSRVLSTLTFVASGLTPLGSLIGGLLIDKMNVFALLLVLNLILFGISMIFVSTAPKEAFLASEVQEASG
ncbi:MFS transporter [Pseudothermotoga thermarum]|uniref:MFS transporter n=1 Tax=Pseudothermotoga thermarum TaxID=119394 RepID=UPI000318F382|nr:MFS transporter [Pseudothermotoga thermarum]